MADKTTPETHVPWYLRVKTLILTAGGLAAAIVSIITLADVFDPEEDTNDEARIESVSRVKPMTLSEFKTEKLGGELPLQPGPRSAPEERSHAGGPDEVDLAASLPTGQVTESTPSPSGTQPTNSEPPSSEPPGSESPSSESTGSETRGSNESVARRLRTDGRVAGFGLDVPDLAAVPGTSPHIAPSIGPSGDETGDPQQSGNSTASSTDELSPDEVVERLLEALAEVEGGDPATLEPRGYLYEVGLAIKGFEDEQLELTYSLNPVEGGPAVPKSWRATNLAYYLVPTTQSDTGVAEIWIPDLKAPGPYTVHAELRLVAEDVVVDSETSEPIED